MRWTPKRKAALVEQFKKNPNGFAQVLITNDISYEEFAEWVLRYDASDIAGLKVSNRFRLTEAM